MRLSLYARIMAQKNLPRSNCICQYWLTYKRIRITKSQQHLEELDDDSTNKFKSNIVERYSIRPDWTPFIDKLCLAEFAACYYKDYRKDSDETNDAQAEVLTHEVIQTHSISQDISLPLTININERKRKNEIQKSQGSH